MKNVTKDIIYVGVNDHKIDLFEGQYIVPNGMAYNSYVILDEKVVVMDTVDAHFFDEWIGNVKEALNGRLPDYLVVQHMEPDHSANIINFLKVYPETVVVGNAQTFKMMHQFFRDAEIKNTLVVTNGQKLELGKHILNFVFAPMVHWPEVMFTYDEVDKVLFSADAFGKFGALDVDEEWACEARRYYIGIVGKYGMQVQAVLKKAATLDIQTICPLHGPILTENLGYYLNLYDIWSSYKPEKEGVFIAYTSVYGHTKEAAYKMKEELEALGAHVAISDLARSDMAENVEDAHKYGRIVLATTTYNMEIFPFMNFFITELIERNYQNKRIAIIENGTWAPNAKNVILKKFEGCKNLTFVEPVVTILSSLTKENEEQIKEAAKELLK